MPKKKDCCSDDDYVLYSCDSESVSSYVVTVSETDDYCSDGASSRTCDDLHCSSSQDSCSSSSRCSCCSHASSSRCSRGYAECGCGCPPLCGHHPIQPVPTVPTRYISSTVPEQPAPAAPTSITPTMDEGAPATNMISPGTTMVVSPAAIMEARNRSFRATITPITDLKTPFSPTNTGGVSFTMRRRNGMVCLQYEPFSATIAANGVSYLGVRQSVGCLPPHPVHIPYNFRLNGEGKTGFIRIDPLDSSANIKFSLDADDRNVANTFDTFETSGGVVCWICSY